MTLRDVRVDAPGITEERRLVVPARENPMLVAVAGAQVGELHGCRSLTVACSCSCGWRSVKLFKTAAPSCATHAARDGATS